MTLSNLPAGVTNETIDGDGFFCENCGEECCEFEMDDEGRCPACAEESEEEDDELSALGEE